MSTGKTFYKTLKLNTYKQNGVLHPAALLTEGNYGNVKLFAIAERGKLTVQEVSCFKVVLSALVAKKRGIGGYHSTITSFA